MALRAGARHRRCRRLRSTLHERWAVQLGPERNQGRDALKKMIAGYASLRRVHSRLPRGRRCTHTANHQLVFTDKDHARIDAYHITMVAGAGRETPPRVAGVGRSIDQLERVNGQWLIKSRNVAPMD